MNGGGDQAGIQVGAFRAEAEAVVPEQFGVAIACGVPVNDGHVRESPGRRSDHRVVRPLPRLVDLEIDEDDLTDAAQRINHLVELAAAERAVVADVDDNDRREPTACPARLEERNHS